MYERLIREALAKMGRIATNPAHVEAWMRLEYGTLDHLGGSRWTRAVKEAADCVDASSTHDNDRLAESYGLRLSGEPSKPSQAVKCECGADAHEATSPMCMDCAGRAFDLFVKSGPSSVSAKDARRGRV